MTTTQERRFDEPASFGWQSSEEHHSGIHEPIRDAAMEAGRRLVTTGQFFTDLQPGDGTRYRLFGVWSETEVWVGYFEYGAYAQPAKGGGGIHQGYAAQKFGIKNEHAACVVADFLNLVLDVTDWGGLPSDTTEGV